MYWLGWGVTLQEAFAEPLYTIDLSHNSCLLLLRILLSPEDCQLECRIGFSHVLLIRAKIIVIIVHLLVLYLLLLKNHSLSLGSLLFFQ